MNATDLRSDRPALGTASIVKTYVTVLALAAILYAGTVQHGPAWQDSGMHQVRVLTGQYHNPLGLALAHPLLIAMGRAMLIFGRSNLPTALNVLSGIGMAVAVANVCLLGILLTGRRTPAILAAIMLAICHTAWWLATVAETYCWVAAGLTTEILLLIWLIRRPRTWTLALLGLVNGLGLSMHNFALLPLPVYAVVAIWLVLRRRLPGAALAAAMGSWLVGATPLGILVIDHGLNTGDWPATIRSLLFGRSWQSEVLSGHISAVVKAALYVGLSWPFASLLPVILGWRHMAGQAGRTIATAIGAITAIHLVFALRYPVPDQFMFLLPSYPLLAIGAAVGIDRIGQMEGRRRGICLGAILVSIVLTPILYGLTPPLLTAMGRSIRPNRKWPYRDENRYWITPWKHNEGSARRFATEALSRAEADAVILPAGMATPPLRAAQLAQNSRQDVTIMDIGEGEPIDAGPADARAWLEQIDRPVYTVNAKPSMVPESMQGLVDTSVEGSLVRLKPKASLEQTTTEETENRR